MSSTEAHADAQLGPRFEDVSDILYGIGNVHSMLDHTVAKAASIASGAAKAIPTDKVRVPTPLVIVAALLSLVLFVLQRLVVSKRARGLNHKHAKFQ